MRLYSIKHLESDTHLNWYQDNTFIFIQT